MNQTELNRQVAEALGESVSTIAHRGFVLERAATTDFEREPFVVDWDELDARR